MFNINDEYRWKVKLSGDHSYGTGEYSYGSVDPSTVLSRAFYDYTRQVKGKDVKVDLTRNGLTINISELADDTERYYSDRNCSVPMEVSKVRRLTNA
jgi:hypothetical protein